MIITSGSQVYLPGQRDAAPASNQADGSGSTPSTSAATGSALLGKLNILSEISTTLGNGRTLSAFRFDLGSSGMDAQLSGSGGAPSQEDKIEDQQMFSSFLQLAAYFGSPVNAKDTHLAGTAALDIRL
jgi:hypothetical protein